MNWLVLKALHQIYEKGSARKKEALLNDSQIKFLLGQTRELKEGVKDLVQGDGFVAYYRKHHLQNYIDYEQFLIASGMMKPQLRYQEADIRILMEMWTGMNNGELIPIRDRIIAAEESVRGVSRMFFRDEKYLEESDSLVRDVKTILGIAELANDKDQQYKYVLESHNPVSIVLCENLDFLKRPSRPRKHHIELWYAGGKNIDKLNYIGDVKLPIFYSCDWDYDGLEIYQAVKKRLPGMILLYPDGKPRSIEKTLHKSRWRFPNDSQKLSGLDPSFYGEKEKELICGLITKNEWIIEESNDLIEMVLAAGTI